MHVNRNDAYPEGTYDKDGNLVPLPDESEENTKARESVILYASGQSGNHPRDVFPDYDANDQSGDVTEEQAQVNDVFAQRPREVPQSEPDATRDDAKGGYAPTPQGAVPLNADVQDRTHARTINQPSDYDPGSHKDKDPKPKPEDDPDAVEGEDEVDEEAEEQAEENEAANPQNPPHNESPRDRREREKQEREKRERERRERRGR
jgi:hypothetical protein